jgi:hypothetical protein
MDVNHIGHADQPDADDSVEFPRFHGEQPARASSGESALMAKLEAMEHRIAALMSANSKASSSSSLSSSSSYRGGDRIPGLQAGDIARLQKENRCFRCKKVGHMKSECPGKPSN